MHLNGLLPFRKRNAFSVEALTTSDAVVLLGMLSVMNAENWALRQGLSLEVYSLEEPKYLRCTSARALHRFRVRSPSLLTICCC